MQLLLIEPDVVLARTYSLALKKAGHSVKAVTNSQAAINSADKHTPDIVILELQLVTHSGIEFLYEFRSYPDWQSIPILIHTNVPEIELRDSWKQLTLQLGVSGYKYKPSTNLKNLIDSIAELNLINT